MPPRLIGRLMQRFSAVIWRRPVSRSNTPTRSVTTRPTMPGLRCEATQKIGNYAECGLIQPHHPVAHAALAPQSAHTPGPAPINHGLEQDKTLERSGLKAACWMSQASFETVSAHLVVDDESAESRSQGAVQHGCQVGEIGR